MNMLLKVFLNALILTTLSCKDHNKGIADKKVDTPVAKPPVVISKLAILEKDLSIAKTSLQVNEMQTGLRNNTVKMYQSQVSNPKLTKTEKEIAKEKLISAKKLYNDSNEERKKIEEKIKKLDEEINTLKDS